MTAHLPVEPSTSRHAAGARVRETFPAGAFVPMVATLSLATLIQPADNWHSTPAFWVLVSLRIVLHGAFVTAAIASRMVSFTGLAVASVGLRVVAEVVSGAALLMLLEHHGPRQMVALMSWCAGTIGLLGTIALALSLVRVSPPSKPMTTTAESLPAEIRTAEAGATPALSNLAVSALVAAFVFPIAAVVLGHIAWSEINKRPSMLAGRGLAAAGMVLGYLGCLILVLLFSSYIASK